MIYVKYNAYAKIKIPPWTFVILEDFKAKMKTITTLNNIIAASTIVLNSKPIGAIVEATPKINKILNILDPIALPTAISFSPFLAATIEVTSSGNEVPTATIVRPTNYSLIPASLAKEDAVVTTNSPPATIPAIPKIMKTIFTHIFLGFSSFSSSTSSSFDFLVLNTKNTK